jgi:hypothetical protein
MCVLGCALYIILSYACHHMYMYLHIHMLACIYVYYRIDPVLLDSYMIADLKSDAPSSSERNRTMAYSRDTTRTTITNAPTSAIASSSSASTAAMTTTSAPISSYSNMDRYTAMTTTTTTASSSNTSIPMLPPLSIRTTPDASFDDSYNSVCMSWIDALHVQMHCIWISMTRYMCQNARCEVSCFIN